MFSGHNEQLKVLLPCNMDSYNAILAVDNSVMLSGYQELAHLIPGIVAK